MADYQGTKDVPTTVSSFPDPSMDWITRFALCHGNPNEPDPLLRFNTLDALDPKFTKALRATKSLGTVTYYGTPLTTYAFKAKQKTSGWWLILAYNGYIHPDEIVNGTRLKIPDFDGFKKAYNASVLQKVKIITF